MPNYYYPIDYYDWALLAYPVALVASAIIAIRLYVGALRPLSREAARSPLDRAQSEGLTPQLRSFSHEVAGTPSINVPGCLEGPSSALSRGLRCAGWLRMVTTAVGLLIVAAVTSAVLQGLHRLSTEKQPPAWAYHAVVKTVFLQVLWGLPFLILVCCLDAMCFIRVADSCWWGRPCLHSSMVNSTNTGQGMDTPQ